MANTTTVTRTGNFISLLFAGTGANFLFSTDTTANPGLTMKKISIRSIMWHPDADGDILVIRDGGSTGAVVFYDEAADSANARVKQYGGNLGVEMNPSITVSQCTSLGAGTLIFEIA